MLFNSNRAGLFSKTCHRNFAAAMLIAFAAFFISTPVMAAAPAFDILDAGDRGTTDIGSAKGSITATYDMALKKDVLDVSYSIPQGSAVTVWVKDFPSDLSATTIGSLKAGVNLFDGVQTSEISVKLEIRGIRDVQSVPVRLKSGWGFAQETIDWAKIGELSEIAFVVSAQENVELAKGGLYLSLDFFKPTFTSTAATVADVAKEAIKEATATPTTSSVTVAKTFSEVTRGKRYGITPIGAAKGSVSTTFDEVSGKDVLDFSYTLPKGAAIQLWKKTFKTDPNAVKTNTIKIGIRIPEEGRAKELSIQAELKGDAGAQNIPIQLKSGWNSILKTVDWKKVGALDEVVFTISPEPGAADPLKGTLYFAVDFLELNTLPQPTASLFNILDAGEKGVFNIGASQGSATGVFDETIGQEVWKFDYQLPLSSIIGVWSKDFHADLTSEATNAVNIGITVPTAEQVTQIAVKVEIKGPNGMQSIPLSLHQGRNTWREPINWNTIGELDEVVFVVSPMAAAPSKIGEAAPDAPATGAIYLDLNFEKLSPVQKYGIYIKIGLLFLVGFLFAFFWQILPQSKKSFINTSTGIVRDFLYGVVVVLMLGVSILIYAAGGINPLDVGFTFNFLFVGLLGALIGGLLKIAHTGKHVNGKEAFQDFLFSGFLAIAASNLPILQAPADGMQLLMLNKMTAAVVFVLYHIFNANALASSGKHLKLAAGAMIVGTPFIFGWLLLLENAAFLQQMAGAVTFGALSAWPVALLTLGRVIVVFGFNEAITNGLGLVTKDRLVQTGKAHLFMLLVSVAVVIAPLIADLGSIPVLATFPLPVMALIAIFATMLSFAGLWGEVYLITGTLLDAGKQAMPTTDTISSHVGIGMKKGFFYSGILMTLLYVIKIVFDSSTAQQVMAAFPLVIGVLAGALIFPLLKTIVETFDGSLPFFDRARYSYGNWVLYLRGAVIGFGFSYMITQGMFQKEMGERVYFGLMIGLIASTGISILRDIIYGVKGQGKLQSWRLYLVDGILGAFVGSAVAFYLDALQVPVVIEKFRLYTSAGFDAKDYITYPLVNKWGRIDLGSYTGGARLIFTESLAGVINWSVAAWLFAVNKVFMQAFFDKDKTPIKFFFSKAGFATLMEHMIFVLRWGLWMSPIIFTFLRMMPTATWYNQDGAIRTGFAIFNNATMSPDAFQAWNLQMFVLVLAFPLFRILTWMDHMGLRVATLVNLSFMGMDKLDDKVAKFIGKGAAQRYIPEGIKRFMTWAPLLIPFYIPRGENWDYAWNTSQAIENANKGKGLIPMLQHMPILQLILVIIAAIVLCTGLSILARALHRRAIKKKIKDHDLGNREYRVTLKANGETFSEVTGKEMDVSRRSYDIVDPCGRVLYIVDMDESPESPVRAWPIAGNFPEEYFEPLRAEKEGDALRLTNTANGIRSIIEITLPDRDSTVEIWKITLENLTGNQRRLKVVSYLEWVLNGWMHDRFHTQYQRLYPEMEYISSSNALIALNKSKKAIGILASDIAPEGFLTGRVDFIGRARSIWSPRILETLNFMEAKDTPECPTFDPIGSLMVGLTLEPRASQTTNFLIGFAKKKEQALELIKKFLKPQPAKAATDFVAKKREHLIGHGEIPPGTPQPYYEYKDNGNKLLIRTPFTPRPFDHGMANPIHSLMVTNRGLHTSCNGNSQQNRLTPDWPDTVTREIPSEAIYLYDVDRAEWYSPTHHPLNDTEAKNKVEFGVDGTAVFRMSKGDLSTQLTVFVPTEDPTGVYLLTVRNHSDQARKIRVAPYFQMTLDFQPEKSGPLGTRYDKALDALFFENPRNTFRSGPAFVSMSIPAECVETKRGKFFGSGRGPMHPYMVEQGQSDPTQQNDDRQIASFIGELKIPANGEFTVAIVLGQTDNRKKAIRLVQKYKNLELVRKSLSETRQWWLGLMGTVQLQTNQPDFDRYQNWLKYQALAERIWARRGFYQTSGAFGFRDQLQDTVNLTWVDPALARKQILLHASQQFPEGDVFHWFFTLTDGRTAFACRSHASDNPLWIAWGVGEYIRITGDDGLLDEKTTYVSSEFPFAPLPKNKTGWGSLYGRSTRSDTVYKHCMRSINTVLNKRMGKHGLPLMGVGDWNDGLDEIGSEGKGESVWLGFFLYYILQQMIDAIERKEGSKRRVHYEKKMKDLAASLEKTWRDDRYLRAIHDNGAEIGIKGSGVWEVDALTAAWSVMTGINFERGVTIFNTALSVLERGSVILLGWPALREDTKPYLGRSSKYPEGVRENGMYCHGVQWLVRAARLLAEEFEKRGDNAKADEYRATAYRLWLKISPLAHVTLEEIEIYGGQPNKQPADFLTTFEPGRMIWNGYTGAAGWMLRQAFEGVVGATLVHNELLLPDDLERPRGDLKIERLERDVEKSPLKKGQASSRNKVGVLPPEAK